MLSTLTGIVENSWVAPSAYLCFPAKGSSTLSHQDHTLHGNITALLHAFHIMQSPSSLLETVTFSYYGCNTFSSLAHWWCWTHTDHIHISLLLLFFFSMSALCTVAEQIHWLTFSSLAHWWCWTHTDHIHISLLLFFFSMSALCTVAEQIHWLTVAICEKENKNKKSETRLTANVLKQDPNTKI